MNNSTIRTAYFAGGCFWCITPFFAKKDGVISVMSGYSGGDEVNPTYEDVKAQKTGHRETILVEYDSSKVSFEELFTIFLLHVDVFDKEGQYIDRGHSYTLALYYEDENDKIIAENKLNKMEELSKKKTYVAIEPFKSFYPAEEYHQDYYLKHPEELDREMKESGRIK